MLYNFCLLCFCLLRFFLGQNAIFRQKSQKNFQPKNGSKLAQKWSKMAKNRQKMVKFLRKIDFLYNNFPKKAISLRKCTQKKIIFAFSEKKVQIFFRACGAIQLDPGGGCYRISVFCASVFCALYLGQNAIFRQKKAIFFGPKMVRK